MNLWQILTHDLSKFKRDEFIPYARFFFGGGRGKVEVRYSFRTHYCRNKHHWQHWILFDSDGVQVLEMPDKYIREMIADWWAAGMSKKGFVDLKEWYSANREKILLHTITRGSAEEYMKELLNG